MGISREPGLPFRRRYHWSAPGGWGWEGPDAMGRTFTAWGAWRAFHRAEDKLGRFDRLKAQRDKAIAERDLLLRQIGNLAALHAKGWKVPIEPLVQLAASIQGGGE